MLGQFSRNKSDFWTELGYTIIRPKQKYSPNISRQREKREILQRKTPTTIWTVTEKARLWEKCEELQGDFVEK